jgi:TRAP-type mannitol/chloroaromatic compound transport system permease large subunit
MGLSVFTINSTLNDPRIRLGDIFIGAAPYVVTMFVVLLAVIFVPDLALALLRK